MANDQEPAGDLAEPAQPAPAPAPAGPGRREALLNGAVALGVLPAAALFGGYALRYLVPPSSKRIQEILLGGADDFPIGATRLVEAFGERVVLLRLEGQLAAFGTRCSHLGCFVQWEPELQLEGEQQAGGFYCPCHAAKFRRDGTVHSGPPPEGLPRFEVTERDGLVYLSIPIYGEPKEDV